ncbi:NfeD family protein [Orenia marismortui]|uniref:Membrane-bound serine protease (ClpP class) n=1 Tax=Orenia marismortui TaxID=46469 RepID=A0A4R8GZN0_9FIRM|nr:nodulation protein NfeD [Orenia marismortui]TDX52123.1 membrane-bound serine protease (ClpP class) [Orenia marismortui]
MKRIILSLLLMVITIVAVNISLEARPSDLVYQIPIQGTVNPGMLNLVRKGIEEAENSEADAIIFKIDTYGGLVDSGIKIRDAIFNSEIPTITYVSNRAWSAGALIALAGEKLIMAPGSSMGAAETRPKEEKYISALRKEFKATAERRDKNPDLAAAMVDSDIEIPELIEAGKLLTLTAQEAIENQMTDLVIDDFDSLLRSLNLTDAKVVEVKATTAEKLARFVTNPNISVILLTVAFIALVFEALAPGWGVGGTIGLVSLALFFSGYIINGVASWGLIILFIVGLILIVLEVFVVPGFGITGIGGIISIFSSLYFLFPSPDIALSILATVLILSIAATIVMLKIFGTSKLWSKISLSESQTKEAGYIAPSKRDEVLDKVGITLTPLRPAGIIKLDNDRLDVVSEGRFIAKGEQVKVVKVEGSRVVVRLVE